MTEKSFGKTEIITYLDSGQTRHQIVKFSGGGGSRRSCRGGDMRRNQFGFTGITGFGFRLLHCYRHFSGATVENISVIKHELRNCFI